MLLLDEPTGALDAAGVARAEAELRRAMARGAALVLVSHDPRQAEALGTQHLSILAGRAVPA